MMRIDANGWDRSPAEIPSTCLRAHLASFVVALMALFSSLASADDDVERCTVSTMNVSAPVQPDGSWELRNVPWRDTPQRVRMVCTRGTSTLAGYSNLYQGQSGEEVVIETFSLGAFEARPESLQVSFVGDRDEDGLPDVYELANGLDPDDPSDALLDPDADGLTALEEFSQSPSLPLAGNGTAQLIVLGNFPDGTATDLSTRAEGTTYTTSNAAIASVSEEGLVAAEGSGTAFVGVLNEGALASIRVRVLAGEAADMDGDGLPDDYEVANGLDPEDPDDAQLDPDADGLTSLEEFAAGTLPGIADTDGDGLADRAEMFPGVASAAVAIGFETSEGYSLGALSPSSNSAQGGWSGGAEGGFRGNELGDEQIVDTQSLGGTTNSWHYARGGANTVLGSPFSPALPTVYGPRTQFNFSIYIRAGDLAGDGSHQIIYIGNQAGTGFAGFNLELINAPSEDGLQLFTIDGPGALTGVKTLLASGLDRSTWHHIEVIGIFGLEPLWDDLFSYIVNGTLRFSGSSYTDLYYPYLGLDREYGTRIVFFDAAAGNPAHSGFYYDDLSYSVTQQWGWRPTEPANPDSDDDGLLDGEDVALGGNPHLRDTDADGLPDGVEAVIGKHATSVDPFADADGDGLSNLDELDSFTDPLNPDSDGDGVTDGDEVGAGSDPNDPSS